MTLGVALLPPTWPLLYGIDLLPPGVALLYGAVVLFCPVCPLSYPTASPTEIPLPCSGGLVARAAPVAGVSAAASVPVAGGVAEAGSVVSSLVRSAGVKSDGSSSGMNLIPMLLAGSP